ncbi:hypothetical protein [Paenibacillus methanolicus]|uniref:Uncharacterized protein n=1 Tax=Paenibacillus methanolicus TaxID=582686 RepID=A0A5S5BQM0_9BACL|nr:hypothetical protein [Paenibacillus methanolicus]TYP69505.1 hypothetical protein BCM02_11421 [Paenibacillus methanolicus]
MTSSSLPQHEPVTADPRAAVPLPGPYAPSPAVFPTPAKSVWTKLAFWMRLTATFSLAFGLFQLAVGLLNFGLGTIAGIVQIAVSIWLFRMGAQAKRIHRQPGNEREAAQLMERLVTYFRLQAVFLVAFGFAVVMLVLAVLQFMTDWDWLIRLINHGKQADKLIMKAESWYAIVRDWLS